MKGFTWVIWQPHSCGITCVSHLHSDHVQHVFQNRGLYDKYEGHFVLICAHVEERVGILVPMWSTCMCGGKKQSKKADWGTAARFFFPPLRDVTGT